MARIENGQISMKHVCSFRPRTLKRLIVGSEDRDARIGQPLCWMRQPGAGKALLGLAVVLPVGARAAAIAAGAAGSTGAASAFAVHKSDGVQDAEAHDGTPHRGIRQQLQVASPDAANRRAPHDA